MPVNERDKRAILLGMAVIGLGLIIRLVVMPFAAHWQDLRSSASSCEQRISLIEQKLNRRDALIERQCVRFGPGLRAPLEPVEITQRLFPQTVQKVLGKGGLGVSSVEPQGIHKLREAPGVVMVSLRVRCNGGPDSLPQALAEVQKAEQLIIIDSIDLSMTQPGDRKSWSVTLLVSTPALVGGES